METKFLKSNKAYYYDRMNKKYYQVTKSIPVTNLYNELIHFNCSVRECELKYSHTEIVPVDVKYSKESKNIYHYNIVLVNINSKTKKIESYICDSELTTNNLASEVRL